MLKKFKNMWDALWLRKKYDGWRFKILLLVGAPVLDASFPIYDKVMALFLFL